MSDLLVNKTSSSAQTSNDTWQDIDGLSETVVIGSGLRLLIATIPFDQSGAGDKVALVRFAVDGVREGPELLCFAEDATDEGCGISICWVLDAELTAGSHKFAVQFISPVGKAVSTDTGRTRSFQVIEITGANLLISRASQSADSAVSGFTDIVDLAATEPVAAVGSILVMLGNVNPETTPAEFNWAQRFTIGGVFEGPEMRAFNDNAIEGCGNSQIWMKTGIVGATAFAMQWDELSGAVTADTARIRSMQVIEITENANLLAAQVSQAPHSVGASYADVPGLVATVDVVGPDSILLFAASVVQILTSGSDKCASYQFFEGGTPEGPEIYILSDSATDTCGHSVYHAATGKSAGSHTFSLRGQIVTDVPTLDTTRNRSLAILELLAAAPAPAPDFRRRRSLVASLSGGLGGEVTTIE